MLRAGVKEPRGPQPSAAPADKQFLMVGAGSASEGAQDSGSSAAGARRSTLGELEELGARERHGAEEREQGPAVCEWFDPLVRSLASQPFCAAPAPVAAPAALPVELEQLMRDLVRRAAWGGDRRRGTARIELGAGELAGATLLVEVDANDLRIDLELPAGVAAEPWRQRLASRLSERGFAVRELHVH